MPHIDPNLLNKIQAIKTLRDRAGTDGEKDAAQNRLTIILAKHKLTEQDIPQPGFSTRGRYQPPPRRRPQQQRTQQQRSAEQAFNETFEQTMRDFADAVRHAERESQPRRQRTRSTRFNWDAKEKRVRTDPPNSNANPNAGDFNDRYAIKTSTKTQWKGRLLHEMARALGFTVWKEKDIDDANSIYWYVRGPGQEFTQLYKKIAEQLKRHCRIAISAPAPDNPNAFRRAFYEAATYEIAARLRGGVTRIPHYKAKEPKGLVEGRRVGQQLPLYPFA